MVVQVHLETRYVYRVVAVDETKRMIICISKSLRQPYDQKFHPQDEVSEEHR